MPLIEYFLIVLLVDQVILIQVALSTVDQIDLQCQIAELASKINSKFGNIDYTPIVYLQQDISFNHYLALFSIADACLITSLRDGMNLTSHEYIICQKEHKGPLIVSEFAGCSHSLASAFRFNPWDAKVEVAVLSSGMA